MSEDNRFRPSSTLSIQYVNELFLLFTQGVYLLSGCKYKTLFYSPQNFFQKNLKSFSRSARPGNELPKINYYLAVLSVQIYHPFLLTQVLWGIYFRDITQPASRPWGIGVWATIFFRLFPKGLDMDITPGF
ncbi:hypothetical protein Q2T40_06185 [Winogradskyella maritima]|nr:hypothetical protein [Winogradskyella maritima]